MQAQDPLHGGAVREALQLPWRAKVPDTIGSDVRLSHYGDRLAFARLDLHRLLQPLEDTTRERGWREWSLRAVSTSLSSSSCRPIAPVAHRTKQNRRQRLAEGKESINMAWLCLGKATATVPLPPANLERQSGPGSST